MAASTIEECDRLLDMINTMLMISKTESGVNKLSCEEIDLAGLIREACELFEPTAEDKKVSLSCDIPTRSHFIGDTRMIQRMLSNLLDNAIKYTPSGERLRFRYQRIMKERLSSWSGILALAFLPSIFLEFLSGFTDAIRADLSLVLVWDSVWRGRLPGLTEERSWL